MLSGAAAGARGRDPSAGPQGMAGQVREQVGSVRESRFTPSLPHASVGRPTSTNPSSPANMFHLIGCVLHMGWAHTRPRAFILGGVYVCVADEQVGSLLRPQVSLKAAERKRHTCTSEPPTRRGCTTAERERFTPCSSTGRCNIPD